MWIEIAVGTTHLPIGILFLFNHINWSLILKVDRSSYPKIGTPLLSLADVFQLGTFLSSKSYLGLYISPSFVL